MNPIHKSESNPNLKYPKNSNRRLPNNPLNKKDKNLLISKSQVKLDRNDNKKSFSTVRKFII